MRNKPKLLKNEVSEIRWLAKRKFLTMALCIFICPIVLSYTEKASVLDEDTAEAPVLHENVEVSYEINEPDDNNTHQEMNELPAIIQPQPPVQPQPPAQPQPLVQPRPPAQPQPPVQPQPERVDNTPIPCSRFKNCTELKRVHPDGVRTARLSCAKDRNKLDRDKDGWACE